MTDHDRAPARTGERREPREGIDESPATSASRTTAHGRAHRAAAPPFRWECPCQDPPVLLATYTAHGRLNIKVRDRYWHLYGFGQVQAICPRCAAEHILDLRDFGTSLGERGQRTEDRG